MKDGASTSSARTDIGLSEKALTDIHTAAAAAYPREACGLLLGEGAQITRAAPARNVHPTPQTHFEIDPQALIDAHKAERAGGDAIIGYYHSHPSGDAVPSKTDRAVAAGDGKVWAIIAGGDVRVWRDDPDGFVALSYSVSNG